MDLKKIIADAHQKIVHHADVKFVFGDLRKAEGKSIIPVSTVKYSLGGGEGKGPDLAKLKSVSGENAEDNAEENRPSGKGIGGKFSNRPLGVFEITSDSTRFIPVIPFKEIIVMLSIWIVASVLKRKRK